MRISKEPDAEQATDNSTTGEQAQTDGSVETTTTAAESTSALAHEPYPGATFFHGGRHSEIVAAMGRRLEQEDCVPEGRRLGPDWTRAHQRAFSAWQHKLRPEEGGDVSGIPDEVAWDRLRVPRVSPRGV